MCIFIEIDWVIKYPHILPGGRNVFKVAHEQHVLFRDNDGWKAPVKIDIEFTRTLNPNLSRIMRSQDIFYLVSTEKMGTEGELPEFFVLDRDRFVQLTLFESIPLTNRIGYKGRSSLPDFNTIIDAETERSGWRIAYLHRDPFFFWFDPKFDYTDLSTTQVKFSWKGKDFAIKGYNRVNPGLLQLVELGNEGEPPHDLVTFDYQKTYIDDHTYRRIRHVTGGIWP